MEKLIVVGVDGSEGGATALEFAAKEAALRQDRLRIVAAWEVPVAAFGAGAAPPLDTALVDAVRVRTEQIADEAVETAKRLQPSLQVDAVTVAGQPADALLAQGADGDLIVVGRRGLGGFRSLLLGSVSQQVVHHASCPVVVVQQPAPVN